MPSLNFLNHYSTKFDLFFFFNEEEYISLMGVSTNWIYFKIFAQMFSTRASL